MYKFSFLFLLLSCLVTPAFSQSISDSEAIRVAVEAKKSGASDNEIASRLLKAGATPDQIQRIRSKYAKQITQQGVGNNVDNIQNRMRVNNGEASDNDIVNRDVRDTAFIDYLPESRAAVKRVFGRDIFNNKNLSFEPVMNIATPQNYVLGPGDQLVLDIMVPLRRPSPSLSVPMAMSPSLSSVPSMSVVSRCLPPRSASVARSAPTMRILASRPPWVRRAPSLST